MSKKSKPAKNHPWRRTNNDTAAARKARGDTPVVLPAPMSYTRRIGRPQIVGRVR